MNAQEAKKQMKKVWWQHHLDMKEDYSDLAWAIYNFEWMLEDSYEVEENDDCMSEQVWAIRNGLGWGID